MKFLKFFVEWLVFSNILVSVAAACMAMETLMFIGVAENKLYGMTRFVFFSTLFIYNFQRLARMRKLVTSNNHRLQWISKNRFLLIALLLVSFVGMVERVLFIDPKALMLLAISGAVSIAYAVPMLMLRSGRFMLRDLPFIKIFLIAIVWTVATVLVPYIDAMEVFHPGRYFYIALAQRFLFIFAITLPFDIRDMRYDKLTGLRTIPLQIGEKKTRKLAMSILVFAFLLELYYYIEGPMANPYYLLALGLTYIITITIVYFASSERSELYFSGLLESTMILRFLLICLSCFVA